MAQMLMSLDRRLGHRHPVIGAARGTPALLQCRGPRTLLQRPSLRLLRLLRGLALCRNPLRAPSQQLKICQALAELRAVRMSLLQQLLRLTDLLHHLHLVCCHPLTYLSQYALLALVLLGNTGHVKTCVLVTSSLQACFFRRGQYEALRISKGGDVAKYFCGSLAKCPAGIF